jgi:ABC-type transport system substrate-binding protein
MDQQGWSDVLAIDALASNELKDIGITMTQKVVDWGTNEADGHSFNYDFMHFVMHFATGTMYDRYQQMFVGTDYYWNHYGDYRNKALTDLLDLLDISTGADQQAVADYILQIMGEDMPIIPFGGHPNWYQYSTKYWLGYSSKDGPQILPAGPFGGSGYSGLLQTQVLGLSASGGVIPGGDTTWIWVAVVVVVVIVVVILGIALTRRRPKK